MCKSHTVDHITRPGCTQLHICHELQASSILSCSAQFSFCTRYCTEQPLLLLLKVLCRHMPAHTFTALAFSFVLLRVMQLSSFGSPISSVSSLHHSKPLCCPTDHRHASKQSALVQKQLIGALAVLLKRGWAEQSPDERHAFFAEVEHTVAASNNAAARCTAIEILEVRLCCAS